MKKNIRIKGKLLDLSEPKVMGIINVTPDSFYDKSRYMEKEKIINQVKLMIDTGATFIDVGACSTRPGSEMVDKNTEKARLEIALSAIRESFPDTMISVDTFRSDIAAWCISEFAVDMINDISGGEFDHDMYQTIAKYQVPYIIMHMRGTPKNMHEFTNYHQLTHDIIYELSKKLFYARQAGINDIIIDPGIGFAKTLEQNYKLLAELDMFQIFKTPILVGLSRKSMIYKLLKITPSEALNGTTALNMYALQKGANILRVHDVQAACQVINIWKQLNANS